ncbi:hypothetical protein FOZ60_008464 [Perkinsus olseni]|uniref:Uncharacterized protein n=1 Tax=Perkinsus olseni TaxID=32597 RepID=A0A7J6PEZ4_PEROL|nr:hypothetical protein FOZ60_008464 [Perkinsus olseni]
MPLIATGPTQKVCKDALPLQRFGIHALFLSVERSSPKQGLAPSQNYQLSATPFCCWIREESGAITGTVIELQHLALRSCEWLPPGDSLFDLPWPSHSTCVSLPLALPIFALVFSICLAGVGDDVHCVYQTEHNHRVICAIGEPDGPVTLVFSNFNTSERYGNYSSNRQRELSREQAYQLFSLEREDAGLRLNIDDRMVHLSRPNSLGPEAFMGVDYSFLSKSPNFVAAIKYSRGILLYSMSKNGGSVSGEAIIRVDGTASSEDAQFTVMSLSSYSGSSSVMLLVRVRTTGRYLIMVGGRAGTRYNKKRENQYWTRESINRWIAEVARYYPWDGSTGLDSPPIETDSSEEEDDGPPRKRPRLDSGTDEAS